MQQLRIRGIPGYFLFGKVRFSPLNQHNKNFNNRYSQPRNSLQIKDYITVFLFLSYMVLGWNTISCRTSFQIKKHPPWRLKLHDMQIKGGNISTGRPQCYAYLHFKATVKCSLPGMSNLNYFQLIICIYFCV